LSPRKHDDLDETYLLTGLWRRKPKMPTPAVASDKSIADDGSGTAPSEEPLPGAMLPKFAAHKS
jgi:hypothetical protein